MPHTDESFDWEELLLLIGEQVVVPIVGKELLVVPVGGKQMLLEHYLTVRLAEQLGVPLDELSDEPDLNEVAVLDLRKAGTKANTRKRLIKKKLREIMARDQFPVPEMLKQLASITQFELFVSTTFDSLLQQALDEVRFGGEKRTHSLAYYIHDRSHQDIPDNVYSVDEPYVYQIFCPVSSSDFAVTEEDHLELLHRLQDSSHQPKMLFDELADKNLLFLGCGFPDGLARSFVRTIANQRLFGCRSTNKLVDSRAKTEASLDFFLRHCGTEAYISGDTAEFVNTLFEKWQKNVGPATIVQPKVPPRRPEMPAPKQESHSIFLSYKSDDVDKVTKLKEALEKSDLKVWFDRDEKALRGGDNWDREIEKGIDNCTLFLAVISRNAQTVEGEFRREWERALKRQERISREVPFIIPILIEDLGVLRRLEGERDPTLIPPEFWRKQAIPCLGGEPSAGFVATVKEQTR